MIQGAFTLWNMQSDETIVISANLEGLSAGCAVAPVLGSGIFVSGAGSKGGRLRSGAKPRGPDIRGVANRIWVKTFSTSRRIGGILGAPKADPASAIHTATRCISNVINDLRRQRGLKNKEAAPCCITTAPWFYTIKHRILFHYWN